MALLPILLIFTGILMVSPLYLPKLVRRENKAFNFFQIANIIAGYTCGFAMKFPEYLMAGALAYGIIGFTIGFFKKGLISPATPPNSD